MTTPWVPDHSALAAFRESPEMFRLKYRHHLVPATPDDKMRAGSAIHAARNVLYDWRRCPICEGESGTRQQEVAHYISGSGSNSVSYPSDVIERAVKAARDYRGNGGGARNADQVELVVRAYAAKYATEPFGVVESERYAEAWICGHPNPTDTLLGECDHGSDKCFQYCGIVDAAIRFYDTSEYVMDLKSTGAYLNEAWETTARLGDQFVGYVALRRALGLRCDGFFVDAIHMRDAKPRKDGSLGTPSVNEDDFVRVGPVSVPEWRVERWAQDVRYTLSQIRALEAQRGLDTPWPIYQNWPYGKVDVYREFYETPVELHGSVAQMFETRKWDPRQVADERKVV